jgi:hypothetical protein
MNLTKCNGLEAANIQPAKTNHTNDLDCPTAERQSKALATATASLALNGFLVRPNPVGGFLVFAHDLSHYAHDLEALQDFAKRSGVNHA